MTLGGSERAALAAAAAWICSAGYCPALAQTPAPAPTGTREAAIDFDIPAQPMAAALNSWAVQANAQVFVDPGPVAHLLAPPIKGTMMPRQALRALLAHSNLQVAQGANGVFVIKPRPAVAAIPGPAAAAPALPNGGVSGPPAETLTARATEGPWTLGVSAQFDRDRGDATGGASAGITGEYFLTDHVAAALAVTAPRTDSFTVPANQGTPPYRASAHLLSSAAVLKYYFSPESRLRAYLGAGIDVAALYGASEVTGMDRVSLGPMVQAGFDFSISPHWLLNTAVSWADIPPDPVQFGLGFVYRFGAAP